MCLRTLEIKFNKCFIKLLNELLAQFKCWGLNDVTTHVNFITFVFRMNNIDEVQKANVYVTCCTFRYKLVYTYKCDVSSKHYYCSMYRRLVHVFNGESSCGVNN